MSRKFGGKVFQADQWFLRKGPATLHADRLRRRGFLARVKKLPRGFRIFRRRP